MDHSKLLIVMVGLPASGKSTLSSKIEQGLAAEDIATKVFNNGDVRREMIKDRDTSIAEFYDPHNPEALALRESIARINMEKARDYLAGPGQVAVLDAANVSRKRRAIIKEFLGQYPIFFVECISQDPELLKASISRKATLPEFAHMCREDATTCFMHRIDYYRSIYQPLTEEDNFVVLDTLDNRILRERVQAVVPYYPLVRDLIVSDWVRNLYVVRHGETQDNVENRIGGDSDLTGKGQAQAQNLAGYFRDLPLPYVFTSTKRRTMQMTQALCAGRTDCRVIQLADLNEIDAGICEGMTYDQIAQTMPAIHEARTRDKYNYVYPEGEGYVTLRERVERGIKKALYLSGNSEHIMIVGHQAVNRMILSHFLYRRPEDVPYIFIPQDRYYHIVSTQNRKVFEMVKFQK
jgi:broad specificity phosphatase PhoE/predicted kinase